MNVHSTPATHATPDAVDPVEISIVIPLLNEEESLRPLMDKVRETMAAYGRSYEVIFIDDGSTDGSMRVLEELHATHPGVVVIQFRRNFGKAAAYSAGFPQAAGQTIITMDADLQDDPAEIPNLIAKLNEGYDLVSGWKKVRLDPFRKTIPSKFFNWVTGRVSGISIHDFNCGLKAYRRQVVDDVKIYGELHRFIPAVASQIGVQVTEIAVNDRPRRYGSSKYGISRTIRVLLDLVTVRFILGYSTRPLQVFGGLGLLTGGVGVVIGLILSIEKLAFDVDIGDRPLLILAVLLVIAGVQLISIGLVAEILVRSWHEIRGHPVYILRDVLEREEEDKGES